MSHTLQVGDRYEGSHGLIWQIDAFGVEKEIFEREYTCTEVACPETRDRSWIPQDSFVNNLNEEEATIALIDEIEECECCGQQQLIHSDEEVTL